MKFSVHFACTAGWYNCSHIS